MGRIAMVLVGTTIALAGFGASAAYGKPSGFSKIQQGNATCHSEPSAPTIGTAKLKLASDHMRVTWKQTKGTPGVTYELQLGFVYVGEGKQECRELASFGDFTTNAKGQATLSGEAEIYIPNLTLSQYYYLEAVPLTAGAAVNKSGTVLIKPLT